MIEIVSATRMTEDEFWEKSALGISLRRLAWDERIITWIAYENSTGLPELFNARIEAKNDHDTLVFIHDDVWIDDIFFCNHVLDGCRAFDVIGVVGCAAPQPNQPGWLFSEWMPADNTFKVRPDLQASGCIGQGSQPFGNVGFFGPSPAACELMDGLFLAMRKQALLDSGVRFDPQFGFHFYDLDFCRTARAAGLRLGTWPVALTHQSDGAYGSKAWSDRLVAYLAKWSLPATA
ncbi:MAG: hypothetical protein EOO28_19030 [Comamonadaceae bacterium]|nr:MAG: hypothetical protein EOO28_19030 [Comamonadaceae bacterium]